jgi:hypothetical protein
MLSFAYKRFEGKVPEPGPLDDEDRALLEKVEAGFQEVGDLLKACKFRAAPSVAPSQGSGLWLRTGLGEALALAREANGETSGAIGTWTKSALPPSQALRVPAPLFKKLDEGVVEEEYARLEG